MSSPVSTSTITATTLLTLMFSTGSRGATLGFCADMISSNLSGVKVPSLLAAFSFCACEREGVQSCASA